MKEITIFHYHLLPGGVTKVITLSVKAVIKYLPEIESITIVCGIKENTDTVLQQLLKYAANLHSNVKIYIDILPGTGYLEKDNTLSYDELKKRLISKYSGSLFWVHNYQLGKNPLFTKTILNLAAENPDEKFLFQIHDFPECSRYDNLKLLNEYIKQPIYPITENIRYAVINSRDRNLLVSAGIPEKQLFLLNNPVESNANPEIQNKNIRNRLKKSFGDKFPLFNPEAQILFYPIRTIRRKNVFEAALITTINETPLNLLATLPGISRTEKPYSDTVEKAYTEGHIPGLWGIGNRLEKCGITFTELAADSDIVVSSSVQEGFGYLFIDAVKWGKPIFARRLDILDGISEVFLNTPSHFYRTVFIPVDNKEKIQIIKDYHSRLKKISIHLPDNAVKKLRSEISELIPSNIIDFSYLSIEHQYKILRKAKNDSYKNEIRVLNKGLFAVLNSLLNQKSGNIESKIDNIFGFKIYSSTVDEIIQSFAKKTSKRQKDTNNIQQNLVNSFASIEYLRLLYE